MLYFKHKDKEITSDRLEIVNNRTIVYHVLNSSLEDGGTYFCYIRIPQRLVFVCMTRVTIGCKSVSLNSLPVLRIYR